MSFFIRNATQEGSSAKWLRILNAAALAKEPDAIIGESDCAGWVQVGPALFERERVEEKEKPLADCLRYTCNTKPLGTGGEGGVRVKVRKTAGGSAVDGAWKVVKFGEDIVVFEEMENAQEKKKKKKKSWLRILKKKQDLGDKTMVSARDCVGWVLKSAFTHATITMVPAKSTPGGEIPSIVFTQAVATKIDEGGKIKIMLQLPKKVKSMFKPSSSDITTQHYTLQSSTMDGPTSSSTVVTAVAAANNNTLTFTAGVSGIPKGLLTITCTKAMLAKEGLVGEITGKVEISGTSHSYAGSYTYVAAVTAAAPTEVTDATIAPDDTGENIVFTQTLTTPLTKMLKDTITITLTDGALFNDALFKKPPAGKLKFTVNDGASADVTTQFNAKIMTDQKTLVLTSRLTNSISGKLIIRCQKAMLKGNTSSTVVKGTVKTSKDTKEVKYTGSYAYSYVAPVVAPTAVTDPTISSDTTTHEDIVFTQTLTKALKVKDTITITLTKGALFKSKEDAFTIAAVKTTDSRDVTAQFKRHPQETGGKALELEVATGRVLKKGTKLVITCRQVMLDSVDTLPASAVVEGTVKTSKDTKEVKYTGTGYTYVAPGPEYRYKKLKKNGSVYTDGAYFCLYPLSPPTVMYLPRSSSPPSPPSTTTAQNPWRR